MAIFNYYLFLAVLQGLSLGCGQWGLLFIGVQGLLIVLCSLVTSRQEGFTSWHGLRCPTPHGIFQDQGLNPCSLPW